MCQGIAVFLLQIIAYFASSTYRRASSFYYETSLPGMKIE